VDHQRFGALALHSRERLVDTASATKLHRAESQVQDAGSALRLLQRECRVRIIRVPEGADSRGSRRNLLQELDLFPLQLAGNRREPRDVAAWPAEARDDSSCHGIADDAYDDGDYPRGPLGRIRRRSAPREDGVDLPSV